MTLTERDLQFDFPGALSELKFDDGSHATTSIQAVDFIVEYPTCYRFIEIKDPDEPGVVNLTAFKDKLKSGELIRKLAGKYRDSFFFCNFQTKTNKDVEYIVLLSMKSLDAALLLAKQDELKRSIPFAHASWTGSSASVCVILNVDQWRKQFGPTSISRPSGGPL